MKIILALCFALFALSSTSAEVRRYLYCSTPDGAQREGKSGAGILVFDIDNGHKFVRRIEIPDMKEGVRGFTGCTATKRLYFGTTNRRMGCFDIESGKVIWNRTYDRGCDRSCITPDGKTIYAPTAGTTAASLSSIPGPETPSRPSRWAVPPTTASPA